VERLYAANERKKAAIEQAREEKLKKELQQVRNPKLNDNENLKDYTPLYKRIGQVLAQKSNNIRKSEEQVYLNKLDKMRE